MARWSEGVGRRRCYATLYVALAAAGGAFALSGNLIVLVAVGLSGTLSTDIIDNGPFTADIFPRTPSRLLRSVLAAFLHKCYCAGARSTEFP